jgi:hypothetical protein
LHADSTTAERAKQVLLLLLSTTHERHWQPYVVRIAYICLYSINLSRLSTYQASATTQEEAKQSVKQSPLQDQELL